MLSLFFPLYCAAAAHALVNLGVIRRYIFTFIRELKSVVIPADNPQPYTKNRNVVKCTRKQGLDSGDPW